MVKWERAFRGSFLRVNVVFQFATAKMMKLHISVAECAYKETLIADEKISKKHMLKLYFIHDNSLINGYELEEDVDMEEPWYQKFIRELQKKLKHAEKAKEKVEDEAKRLRGEVEDLKRQLKEMAMAKEAKRPRFPDYGLQKHERSLVSSLHKSTGRIPFEKKLQLVQFTKDIYPEGIAPEKCVLRSQRIVTHLNGGMKEIWLYRMYREKWGKACGKIPDVFGKSEYGVSVVVALGFLVYVLKLSQDQAGQVLSFFAQIELTKSEIESLLGQLGRAWEKDHENISNLVLFSEVVFVDETGWKIGKENCYTWIFKSLNHTLLLYGEKRDEEVLDRILPRKKFSGVGSSDCYKIYENRFRKAQKCWAHFLRKAIKLMLFYPEKKRYSEFFKGLYAIFVEAKSLKLQEVEKEKGIAVLESKVEILCTEKLQKLTKQTLKDEREFVNLQKNLTRNLKDLFTFVSVKGVDPTNNTAEQGLRHIARSRNNYQTSKSKAGANRHSILSSVFFSLKQNLKEFTMKKVTDEVIRWQKQGKSLFAEQLQAITPN